jgi:LuxR family maltose regulon positive regulatory protein
MANETIIGTILRTKLHRPPVPRDYVHRPRLLEYLDKRRERPLTLVSAPAGYGKSVLISSWLETCGSPGAWFSLDEQDNDLRQFLSYLLAAVQTMFPDTIIQQRPGLLMARVWVLYHHFDIPAISSVKG